MNNLFYNTTIIIIHLKLIINYFKDKKLESTNQPLT
jgi:hypothetical protein